MKAKFTFATSPDWTVGNIPEAVVGCLPPKTGFTLTYNFAGGYVEENQDARTEIEPSYTLTIAAIDSSEILEVGAQLAKTFGQKEVLVESDTTPVIGLVGATGKWRLA